MIWSEEFVELDKSIHDRDSFDCGESELNKYIQEYAARHMEANISRTMVLPASEILDSNNKYKICAFYTITPSSVKREHISPLRRRRLPDYPIPVFLIAQMAVSTDCQGQGLGKITLLKALEHLFNLNKEMRAYAVIVDCLNKDIEEFYLKYQFEILDSTGDRTRMYLPMDIINRLFQ